MELEYWHLLLLPFFFALGWVAARIDIHHVVRDSRALPRAYFQGLSFLLSEQPDKAIDAFLEVSRQDSQTIELDFALGGLFRRQGVMERAIHTHLALAERDGLNETARLEARLELGLDYLKAGLLDRAEAVFEKLRDTPLKDEAERQLLEVCQIGKDWEKAIAIARIRKDPYADRLIAHFCCERAELALDHSRFSEALTFLAEAREASRQCARASALAGEVAMRQNDPEGALNAWREIERQDPGHLALIAPRVLKAYAQLERPEEGMTLLRAWLERYPSPDLLETVYQGELARGGAEAAYQLASEELKRQPDLPALEAFLDARLRQSARVESRNDLELALSIVRRHTRQTPRYHCHQCGFRARQFYWRCPACGGWETCLPRHAEGADALS
ncbi:MAG: lipopolysaccharide assembly protein LapB [Zoogloeaceae bacterium]|jgi:lipopolysaccharide biosynthesis regulator YciM|nr:lipopolysaccharide assembly protein LapB [Zoogloeaceae bacterium]